MENDLARKMEMLSIQSLGNEHSQSTHKPTDEYNQYEQAYEYFNANIFQQLLPFCFITLQRRRHTKGYFSSSRFSLRRGEKTTDEIALNPDMFLGHSDKEILSTLVHVMVHLAQHHYGNPGRGHYHNQQWANFMIKIGLKPISLERPGLITGHRVTHEIIKGGLFDVLTDNLLATGFRLNWQSQLESVRHRRETEGSTYANSSESSVDEYQDKMLICTKKLKTKYTCPNCKLNAWAKPNISLYCGKCRKEMK